MGGAGPLAALDLGAPQRFATDLQQKLQAWTAKQPPYVDVLVAAALAGGQGGGLGYVMGLTINPETMSMMAPPGIEPSQVNPIVC